LPTRLQKDTFLGNLTPNEFVEIENALNEILMHGYGSLEIVVERNAIVGFRKTISEKFEKFKQSNQQSNQQKQQK